jgi:hypothetical protein
MKPRWYGPCESVIVIKVVFVVNANLITRLFVPALVFVISGLPSVAAAQQSIGELYATDASVKGSVILAGSGTSVLSGSQIAAGARAATLKLERGGSLLVCPGTTLSVAASQTGRQLQFSVNSGNLELDYPLGSASDNLITPDFRLLLPGPGRIHVAVRVSGNGDTCVQSLATNSSALVVAEAMGDESYQVKQEEAVLFKSGHIQGATATRQSCGCQVPPPVQFVHTAPSPETPVKNPPPTSGAALAAAMDRSSSPEFAADPQPPVIADMHMTADARFVFHGDDTPPALTEIVAHLKLESGYPMALQPQVLPPGKHPKKVEAKKEQTVASNQSDENRSVFGKIGAFFASMFR